MSGTILIVEDEESIRILFSAILKRHGYTVLEAGDAPTGIDLAKVGRPDLILMDIQLPGMDGLRATTIIHEQPGLEGVPVIALTGHVTAEHRRRASEAGCAAFLGKPVLAKQLIEAITQALDRQAGAPDTPS